MERDGMRRARDELTRADLAVVVLDARDPDAGRRAVADAVAEAPQVLWLHNKADLLAPGDPAPEGGDALLVSARTGAGIDVLHRRLRAMVLGGDAGGAGDTFSARARHVDGLRRAAAELGRAGSALQAGSIELAAE